MPDDDPIIETVGDLILTSMFWDCECPQNFIKAKSLDTCPVCFARREDQPDARLEEVLKQFFAGDGLRLVAPKQTELDVYGQKVEFDCAGDILFISVNGKTLCGIDMWRFGPNCDEETNDRGYAQIVLYHQDDGDPLAHVKHLADGSVAMHVDRLTETKGLQPGETFGSGVIEWQI